MVSLGEITKVNSGFRQRRYIDEEGMETCKLIKFKQETNQFDEIEEIRIHRKLKESYYLNKNDLIMKLTPNFEAKTIDFQEENLTVPINYAIIHNINDLNPVILEYVLNSENIKKQLKRLANPTRINSINIKTIQDLKIPEFNIEEEKILTEIIKNYQEREELLKKELNLYEKQINSMLFNKNGGGIMYE